MSACIGGVAVFLLLLSLANADCGPTHPAIFGTYPLRYLWSDEDFKRIGECDYNYLARLFDHGMRDGGLYSISCWMHSFHHAVTLGHNLQDHLWHMDTNVTSIKLGYGWTNSGSSERVPLVITVTYPDCRYAWENNYYALPYSLYL